MFKSMRLLIVLCVVFAVVSLGFGGVAAQDELSETFTSEDETLSFSHPDGWVASEGMVNGVIYLASSETALNSFSVPEGDVYGIIYAPPLFDLIAQTLERGIDDDLEMALMEFSADTFNAEAELSQITIGEKDAWIAIANTEYKDRQLVFIDQDEDRYFVVYLEAAVGNMTDLSANIYSVLETLTYTPPSAPELTVDTEEDDGIVPVIGFWGGVVNPTERFKVFLVNVGNDDMIGYIGIVCAPNQRIDSQGIVTLGDGVPVSDNAFTFETDQVIIEGQFISSTQATGIIRPKEDLSFCGIPDGETEWSSECDLSLSGIGVSFAFAGADGDSVMLYSKGGLEFGRSEQGSCFEIEAED